MTVRDRALNALRDSSRNLTEARLTHSVEAIAVADAAVRTAVAAARELDVTWGVIGKVVGVARGNAYQRYRPRPSRRRPASVRHDAPPL